MGPGRNSALAAIRSSSRSGFISRAAGASRPIRTGTRPSCRPRNSSNTRGSSYVSRSRSSGSVPASSAHRAARDRPGWIPLLGGSVSRISPLARSMTLSVRSPRKSIFSSPIRSHVGPSHCVTTSSNRRLVQRHDLVQRTRRHDHPRRVHRRVPRLALQHTRRVDQPRHHRVLVVPLLQIRLLLQRLIERDVQLLGHKLRELVDIGQWHVQHTPHVPDRRPRLQRPERDDLRHVPVLLTHVIDHLRPTVLAKVDIDIRVLRPVRVREPLEQQPVMHRARVRQPQQRTPPSSPRPTRARSPGSRADEPSSRSPTRSGSTR